MRREVVRIVAAVALILGLVLVGPAVAARAAGSSSPHFMVTDPQFGTGSSVNDCSGHYCANSSAGDTTAGQTGSDNYKAQAGGDTSSEPLLEVSTSGGIANLGTLSTTAASTLTMTVSVRCYLTGGYIVQISGDAPSYGLHELPRLTAPTASQPGKEQFGINLVANTTPAVGHNPAQVPSSKTSFGEVTDNYKIANQFMYKDGDIVAQSLTDSGQTDYTISMILNISNATPSGWYTSMFSAVVVPVY
jgi:hypothetical protein